MRVLACLICLLVPGVCGEGQPAKNLAVRHLSGTVVDENDRPVAEARIEHGGEKPGQGYSPQAGQTDAAGKFSVEVYSPAVVIRKAGYKSVWLRVQDSESVQVQLDSLTNFRQSFPVCDDPPLSGNKRFGLRFKLPETRQLKMSTGSDVDFGVQFFRLKGAHGKSELVHGFGPTWSFGIPLESDVWNSVVYEERVSSIQQIPVLDARGILANGKRWRLLGIWGETVGYDGVDERAAAVFDAILDRTCFLRAEKP